ncbi:AmmeMemoRadiSam system protein B [candidate division WOR-3 bacterium]|nr:AmmeMemoRadiSam system protein B [candidate division WOR-3 bacterium]
MTREPAVAGQFYPGRPEDLAAMVDALLTDNPAPEVPGRVIAIQVPHAGYPFSGPTAAHAFNLMKDSDSVTVVMVGPSHRAFVDKAAVYAKGKWKTPLGEVAIDEDLAKALLKESDFLADMPAAHVQEHSLEVQVPFLQRVMNDFRIVPVMLLQPTWEQCEAVGKAIASASKGRKVLLLASTDLYHGESYDDAKRTDSVTGGLLAGFDARALFDALRAREAQACGGDPVVAVMVAARELGADSAVLLHQTNSNDVTGERGGYCVGYSATAFVATGEDVAGVKKQAEAAGGDLSADEQQSLLAIARKTLEEYIRTGRRPTGEPATPRLAEKRGAFVTLHRQGELRGCIGYVEAVKPLYEAVADMAVAASTEDPRFPAVRPEELGEIDIEITVLSPLRETADPDSVEVGRHGLVVRHGFNSGLLLPQVPVEQGWNRDQFLDHTCLKAGLPPRAWRDRQTRLFVFTGQVFGEAD